MAAAGLLAVGCAGPHPEVKVLGVSNSAVAARSAEKNLVVFLEVVNPTHENLELSRLDYRLHAADWINTRGRVTLARAVSAGSSAVVEIAVPLAQSSAAMPKGVAYTLEGELFARDSRIERSWRVAARGALAESSSQSAPLRIRIADRAATAE